MSTTQYILKSGFLNLATNDLSMQDVGTRAFSLGGSLSTDKLVFKNASSQTIAEFRGDRNIKFDGNIGQGTEPVAGVRQFVSASGQTYGVYVTSGASVSQFIADTPSFAGYYARRVLANGIGFRGESILTSGSNRMFVADIQSNVSGNTTGFDASAPSSSGITGGDLTGFNVHLKNASANNRGIKLDVSGSSGVNHAIDIVNGDIKVPSGAIGFTGTGSYTNFTIEKGIITAAS